MTLNFTIIPPFQAQSIPQKREEVYEGKKPLQNIFRKGFWICIKFYSSLSASSAMPSIKFVITVFSSVAFFEVITGLPEDSSMAFLVSPAMLPPFWQLQHFLGNFED